MKKSKLEELLKQGEELNRIIRKAMLTVEPLDADYNFAGRQWREDKKNLQFWSRTVIRCLCADIEARLYVFRTTALQTGGMSKIAFTKDEMEVLTETRTAVVNGVPISKPKWLPTKDTVKESLRLFAKGVGATFNVDCGTSGCQALCETFQIRHRLMHPKDTFALGIIEADVKTAERGIDWFNIQCGELFAQCQAHIAANIENELKSRKSGN